jgi:hypothetical protein
MQSIDVHILIQNQIRYEVDVNNDHGVNLNECLVTPHLQEYLSWDGKEKRQLWTVLEELPDGTGYKIFFDEEDESFGLGILSNKDELINIGTYGDFIDALKSM